MTSRPRLFLGSSLEGLQIAEVVNAFLGADFDVRPWNKGLFVPGHYTLETLDEVVRTCMFAVIIGTADDQLAKRTVVSDAIRDNLLLELGLFMGVLGRHRAILVTPEGVPLALPSDLNGLTRATYQAYSGPPTTKEWMETLSATCGEITRAFVAEIGRERQRQQKLRAEKLRDARQQAVARLHRAVTQLRDLFIELPTNALAALGDKMKFDKVKSDASARVRDMEREWQTDAGLLEVTPQLEALVFKTCRAIEAFPYPAIQVSKETVAVAKRIAAWAGEGKGLGDVFEGAAGQLSEEVARKAEEFAEMYRQWWHDQASDLRNAANVLQDALMIAALKP